jgi:adenylosuccinate synthase
LKDKKFSSFADIDVAKCALDESNVIIFEGSQGLLLDMDCGFMPHCTPSRVGLNGIPEEFLDNAEVYLVMRTYLTRHGNGWTPAGEDLLRKNYINLAEPTNRDDGAQGKFKIGAFDLKLLERVVERHHFDNYIERFGIRLFAVVTHLDSLKDIFYYTRDGNSISSMFSSSGLDGMVRFLKQEITSASDVYIDRVYGSYRVNNFKLL